MGFKSGPVTLGTTDTDIFEMPALTTGAVVLAIGNLNAATRTLTLKFFKQSTGVTTTLCSGVTIAAQTTAPVKFGIPLAMEAGDKIIGSASAISSLVVTPTITTTAPNAKIGLEPKGEWSSGSTYAKNDVVSVSGVGSFISMQGANTNHAPASNPSWWMSLAAKGDTGAAGAPDLTVRARTTANVNLAGGGLAAGTVIDGVTLVAGNVVLVMAQTTAAENGVYDVPASGAASRDSDYSSYDSHPGLLLSVQEGTAWADTFFLCTSNKGGTLGTTAITFGQVNPPASTSASGIVELATDAEAQAKTDTVRAITPSNLSALGSSATFAGLIEIATDAEAQAKTDTVRALVPSNLAALGASATFSGLIEIATDAEASAKTDTVRALVPSNLAALAASSTFAGLIEIATDAEAQAKADTVRALVPSNLASLGASATFSGLIEIATNAEAQAKTDTVRALVPSNLAALGSSTTFAGLIESAVASEYQSNTAGALALTPAEVWSAAAEGSLTDGATIAVDMSTFINATVTLGGNRTLGNPTNEKVGQSGVIRIVQDATGSRTLAYGTDWEFASGTAPILSTAANKEDLLFYHVLATNRIFAALQKATA